MYAIKLIQYGPPEEALRLERLQLADPGPDEVRLRLIASPINPMDQLLIRGHYPLRLSLPAIPGAEACCEVQAIGDRVDTLEVGDVVLLPIRAGGWRTHLNHPARTLLRLPRGVDTLHASMLRINGSTADALLAPVSTGDTIIQSAAAGGVGRAVIQLACRRGIRTINVVRDPRWIPVLSDLGATHTLLEGPDLHRRVRHLLGREPARAAFDGIGGDICSWLARCVENGGIVYHYGAMSRRSPVLGVADAIFRGVSLRGFWLYTHNQARGPQAEAEAVRHLTDLRFHIDRTFPLADFTDAFDRAVDPDHRGRVLFTP